MISLILYGRNDSHGYNLHKRAAISLNCIAEVLSDPDDEVIFVDYNTPNDLPTFIEAIYDTLTPKAKSRLRVMRIRPELHRRLVRRTHLFALEPHSRNIAIRRSNPRNRWILATNTDMIFLPRAGVKDLTEAARDIPDGQYIVPRYELPEPLWESFPRTDPHTVMQACEDLGTKLHLEEVAIRFPYMRFDSPGDFQLAPRQAMFDIHGFDENMIDGWHADSNLCKRLYIYYGERTESLGERIKGYHCDHTRVATLAHRLDIKLENDLQQFVFGVKEAVVQSQAETWGAPNEEIEEVDFRGGPQARFVRALERTLAEPQTSEYHTNANELRNFVWYPQEHALPYVAGNLTVYPRQAKFAYAGNNPRMLDLTARCIAEMGFTASLHYVAGLLTSGAAPQCAIPINNGAQDELLEKFDLLIFDFGLDQNTRPPGQIERVTEWPRDLRYSLGAIARYMKSCAERSDEIFTRRSQIPDFLVLNANHYVFAALLGQYLLAADTPYPTHVRKGRPRVGEERLYRSSMWKYSEDLLRTWFGYDVEDYSVPVVQPGEIIDMTSAANSSRFRDGDWGAMDSSGCWIDGHRASIVFAPPPGFTGDLVAYVRINESFIELDGTTPMYIQVSFEGEPVARWTLYLRLEVALCKAVLPGRLLAGKSACRLEFHVENPLEAERIAQITGRELIGEDPRLLGVRVQHITLATAERLQYEFLQTLDFTQSGEGNFYTNECWTPPDGLGVWTLGPTAGLVLVLKEPIRQHVQASFTITDVAINDHKYPLLDVEVHLNGRKLTDWSLGPERTVDERHVLILDGFPTLDPIHFTFHVKSPRSPKDLEWSTFDTRPLGFRLTKFRLGPARALTYALGEYIDFTQGGNANIFVAKFMGTQWGLPDRYGSWTLGEAANIRIPFEVPPEGEIPAAFVISDCMVTNKLPQLDVIVKANGSKVAEWALGPDRSARKVTLTLPAAVARTKELLLTFEIPTPRSPAALGWSTDQRPLGLRLAAAVIGSDKIEVPSFKPRKPQRRGFFTRLRGLPAFAMHLARLAVRRLQQ